MRDKQREFTWTRQLVEMLGFEFPVEHALPMPPARRQVEWFRYLRVLFGAIWLYDAWNFSSGTTKMSMAQFLGLPMSSAMVHLVGTGIMFAGLYVALTLLSGKGMRSSLWIGILFLAVMWIGVEHGGDFNPSTGGTDAGIAPPYMIALMLTYLTWRMSRPAVEVSNHEELRETRFWIHAARVMFGFLWTWDAIFKLQPYFFHHMVDFVSSAESGQPGFVVVYLQLWVALITHTSPLFFAVMSAVTEASVAWSLLTGKMLSIFLPVGFIFSLMIWTTAEGFGGPYSIGSSGMPGNMFGTAIIYALIFAYLMAIFGPPLRAAKPA